MSERVCLCVCAYRPSKSDPALGRSLTCPVWGFAGEVVYERMRAYVGCV